LSADTRELARGGIRARHPDYTEEEVERALRRLCVSTTRAMTDGGAGAFLSRLTAKLAAAGVPNMVVGSFASSFHGVPRSSQDLDLGIDPQAESLRHFLSDLPPEDYYADADAAFDARGHFPWRRCAAASKPIC
jgi:hypothetical protein